MTVSDLDIPGLRVFEPRVFEDTRGAFMEVFHAARYAEHGLDVAFVQDNLSRSAPGVVRGLHFQKRRPQGKLVLVLEGAIFDVAVDLRRDSPTFGQHAAIELSAANRLQLWVPPGFAHGFCALGDGATVLYKCTELYQPEDEGGLRWDDSALGIEWPVTDPLLSDRDRVFPPLAELDPDELPAVAVEA